MATVALATVAGASDPAPPVRRADPARLVAALADDGIRWNASRAIDTLTTMVDPPVDLLEAALDSDDWQQRQLACLVLWRLVEPDGANAMAFDRLVSDRLLEVTVEGLRDDALPYDRARGRYSWAPNAACGFSRLVAHAERARPLLENALESDDLQQRLLAALILGFAGVKESADAAAPILLPHLRDNDIPQDARWAVHALHGFGDAALPHIARAMPHADDQQRQLLELLLRDITDPPDTPEKLRARKSLNHITKGAHDPAIEPPTSLGMWWLWDLHKAP